MLRGRVGLSPVMIGRAATLERLRAVVDQAELGTTDLPAIALVAGEAGIGKTRLVREVVAALPADVRVFSAAAEPSSIGRPFDVARQLDPLGVADPTEADASGRERHGDGAVDAIGAAARSGRVVVVVEDLHWIDADSVAVLDAIARRPWPNVVIVATYRPGDLRRGAPGGDLVLRLERRNQVEQVRLDRLDRNEVSAMMSAITLGPVSSAAVEAVHRRSGGVPFVVEELMRCAGPGACTDDIVSAQLPWSLEEAVRQQVADLAPAERSIVDALGVFGEPATFEVLAELTGLDDATLLTHLRPLVARGVVEESRDDRLWFAHALLADAVPHQLLGRERRRLHERCFQILLRVAPDRHAALAMHAAGAGRYDELVPIAREGARRSLDRGATFQALRLACEGLSEAEDDPDLLAVATEAAWRLDFPAEALEHGQRWAREARTSAERIDALRYVGRSYIELGRVEHSDEALRVLTALADDDELSLAERARAEAAVAQLQMLRRMPDTIGWAERAIAHAREAGDRRIEVQARVERASSSLGPFDRVAALDELRAAAAAARELGDDVLLSRALNNAASLLQPNGAECRTLIAELRRTTGRSGLDKLGHINVLWLEAAGAFADGDLAANRRLTEEWASWISAPLAPHAKAGDLADLALEEGRIADAKALLEASEAQRPAVGAAGWFVGCGPTTLPNPFTHLSLAALEHDRELGRASWESLLSIGVQHDSWWVIGGSVDAVQMAMTLGVTPAEVRERLVAASLVDHPLGREVATLLEGPLLLAEGRAAAAVAAYGAVAGDLETRLARPVRATYELAHAQALLACGERERALEVARGAAALLVRWPGWRRDRVDAMLARLEGTTSRAVGELTPREAEVAALIALGLTNGQLAERLYISPKTAAVHVSNILAKLSLSGRAEIAAWAVRHELAATG